MLRFVVLTHDHLHLHWDFLVEMEAEGALRSWRLERPPEIDTLIPAEALPDHRRFYLDYEGPIGGDRGEVKRWDIGEAKVLSESPKEIAIEIKGQRIQGKAVLTLAAENDGTFQLVQSDSSD